MGLPNKRIDDIEIKNINQTIQYDNFLRCTECEDIKIQLNDLETENNDQDSEIMDLGFQIDDLLEELNDSKLLEKSLRDEIQNLLSRVPQIKQNATVSERKCGHCPSTKVFQKVLSGGLSKYWLCKDCYTKEYD